MSSKVEDVLKYESLREWYEGEFSKMKVSEYFPLQLLEERSHQMRVELSKVADDAPNMSLLEVVRKGVEVGKQSLDDWLSKEAGILLEEEDVKKLTATEKKFITIFNNFLVGGAPFQNCRKWRKTIRKGMFAAALSRSCVLHGSIDQYMRRVFSEINTLEDVTKEDTATKPVTSILVKRPREVTPTTTTTKLDKVIESLRKQNRESDQMKKMRKDIDDLKEKFDTLNPKIDLLVKLIEKKFLNE